MSATSTPYISTPYLLQNGRCPWVLNTPESSPMFSGVEPVVQVRHLGSLPCATPSRDFLRTVCEPFFDDMLTAIQEALKLQCRAQLDQSLHHCCKKLVNVFFQSACDSSNHFSDQASQNGAHLDDASTEAEDVTPFASILPVGPSEANDEHRHRSHWHSSDEHERSGDDRFADDISRLVEQTMFGDDNSPASWYEDDKTSRSVGLVPNDTVCKHWKCKGFCRLEETCKFDHPQHLRGVGVAHGVNKSGAGVAGVVAQGDDEQGVLSASMLKRHKKRRSGKKLCNANIGADGMPTMQTTAPFDKFSNSLDSNFGTDGMFPKQTTAPFVEFSSSLDSLVEIIWGPQS